MKTNNPENERIKRQYLAYLKQALGHSEQSIDATAKAIARFEEYTKYKSFKAFHFEQATAFKNHLAKQDGQQSGQKLSKATLYATLTTLKRFFQWLSQRPGYRSRFRHSDADYFNLSDNEVRIATTRRHQKAPTLEQLQHVISMMPTATDIECRNRALIAFTLLTGARDGATASMKLKHVDLQAGCVMQDAREVKTKFAKTFPTYFFPVGGNAEAIFKEWVQYLRQELLWSNDDPLFPATRVEYGSSRQFEVAGLDRKHWCDASPIRRVFREAFEKAGLPYFNPHSFRDTLVHLGQQACSSPEAFKAWSQNLGHEKVMTTFYSYGEVSERRQADLIRGLSIGRTGTPTVDDEARRIAVVMAQMRKVGALA